MGRIHSDQGELGVIWQCLTWSSCNNAPPPLLFLTCRVLSCLQSIRFMEWGHCFLISLPVQLRRRAAAWCSCPCEWPVRLYKHCFPWFWGAVVQNAFLVQQQILLPFLHFLGLWWMGNNEFRILKLARPSLGQPCLRHPEYCCTRAIFHVFSNVHS